MLEYKILGLLFLSLVALAIAVDLVVTWFMGGEDK